MAALHYGRPLLWHTTLDIIVIIVYPSSVYAVLCTVM